MRRNYQQTTEQLRLELLLIDIAANITNQHDLVKDVGWLALLPTAREPDDEV